MLLAELLAELPEARIYGQVEGRVRTICCDSRAVQSGDLFVALSEGQQQDRHEFVGDALQRGAVAVVVEKTVGCMGTQIVVDDCRRALPRLARRFYGAPDESLVNIGVTGTNGKTTTAFLMKALLNRCDMPCGYIGTLGYTADGVLQKGVNTTPEADVLQRYLRAFVDAGMQAAALEVSSHGLALRRVEGIPFRVAVGTNLTRDHLDFHGDYAAYSRAKARLFSGLDQSAYAVLNADDPQVVSWAQDTAANVVTYGLGQSADWRAEDISLGRGGTHMRVVYPEGTLDVETPLRGEFNCYNLLAVLASAYSLGFNVQHIGPQLARLDEVPGRFESLREGQPFSVVVDYAHTPDALENVLRTARQLTQGKLICVFGCGGDRDRGKREPMGRIAGEWADTVWVTSDNPRGEDPLSIIRATAEAIPHGVDCRCEVDRGQAIERALRDAMPGDVVLIAGKGHEGEQIIGDRVIPFDDRAVARSILHELKRAN